jgi:hypothetical protein
MHAGSRAPNSVPLRGGHYRLIYRTQALYRIRIYSPQVKIAGESLMDHAVLDTRKTSFIPLPVDGCSFQTQCHLLSGSCPQWQSCLT